MKTKIFLVVHSSETVRVTKTSPILKSGEIQIHTILDFPDSLFRKPVLDATIVVPPNAVPPLVIPVETQNNIKGAIEAASGMDVHISFSEVSQ